ncbi:MAG TPA: DUF4149 domain-containing protein [Polyangiaceae bacterium]|jgi:uncharacterized membrane protein
MKPSIVRLAAGSIALLAAGVWLGGILVLGAIVAPTVFGMVPAPTSADAMTIVFTSFDKIAMTAAAIVAVCEVVALRARAKIPPTKIDVARLAVIGAAGALAVVQGLWLSPTIVALHRDGAVRGSGELGQKLERFHSWSETCGKTESLLLVALVVLLAHALARGPREA